MNNSQIRKHLNSHPETRTIFASIHAADTLPSSPRKYRPCAYVANTDISGGEGKHWIGFFFCKQGLPEYFDSYGFPPSLGSDFERFLLEDSGGYRYISCPIQHPLSTSCGQHVIHFILQRCRNHTMKNIMKTFCGEDLWTNDQIVTKFVEKNFSTSLKVLDEHYLGQQISKSIMNMI